MPAKTRSKPAKSTPAKPRRTAAELGPPSEEEIRQRAYEIYMERGGEGGNHVDDWEEARRELMSRRVRL